MLRFREVTHSGYYRNRHVHRPILVVAFFHEECERICETLFSFTFFKQETLSAIKFPFTYLEELNTFPFFATGY